MNIQEAFDFLDRNNYLGFNSTTKRIYFKNNNITLVVNKPKNDAYLLGNRGDYCDIFLEDEKGVSFKLTGKAHKIALKKAKKIFVEEVKMKQKVWESLDNENKKKSMKLFERHFYNELFEIEIVLQRSRYSGRSE